ncbi:hypothetical protein quinque_014442 [Culex quinquefasciatus]
MLTECELVERRKADQERLKQLARSRLPLANRLAKKTSDRIPHPAPDRAHFTSNCSILLAGANKLLLDLNPRSGKAAHMLKITRLVTDSSRLLENALVAIRQVNVNQQILGLFTKNERITNEIRQGCVDCLESKQVSEFLQQEG